MAKRSLFDQLDQAITQLLAIRDTIMPIFQQHAYLGGVAGVDDSRVRPGAKRLYFAKVQGNDYLVHEMVVEVRSQYSVPIGVDGV